MPESSSWFICPRPNPKAHLRLFCFSYAGGGRAVFREWPDQLASVAEIHIAQLPGRWPRINEEPFTSHVPLINAIIKAVAPFLDLPVSLFGHSMGAILCFELARQLRREYRVEPVRLFVSGRSAPQIPDSDPPTYNLPKVEFISEVRRLNGTPREVLENAELMDLILPALRADFSVCQTYTYVPESPLSCPISAFGGIEDGEVTIESLEAWREQTSAPFSLRMLPGDHFFLHSAQSSLLDIIAGEFDMLRRD